jgi:hypothetical protein
MYAKNFGISTHSSTSANGYFGDTSPDNRDFLRRYLDNHESLSVGKILDVFMGGYAAHVSYKGGTSSAIFLAKMLGGYSGTDDISIPSVGSSVLLWRDIKNTEIYVVGCLPDHDIANGISYDIESSGKNVSNVEHHQSILYNDRQRTVIGKNNDRPVDVFPGETGMINELGNTISLLRGLVMLKATDLSQIQLHTIDDLIKIVGRSLEIFTSTVKDMSYNNNGRCSREIDFYSSQEELLGDTQISTSLKNADYYIEPRSDIQQAPCAILHMGDIGKLFTMYVNDGDTSVAKIKIGESGRVAVESTKSVDLALVGSIKSQSRQHEYYDDQEAATTAIPEFTYTDGGWEPQSEDRRKWNSNSHDHQQYNASDWTSANPDTASSSSQFSLRENGTFILKDINGSFIESDSDGNIVISCPGNIMFRSGDSCSFLAGHNLDLRAKDNIDLCASEGDIRSKAENAIQVYSKTKGVLIETDSSATPDAGIGENHNYGGVKITANNAPVSVTSGANVNLWADQSIVVHGTQEARIESPLLASLKSDVNAVISGTVLVDLAAVGGAINMSGLTHSGLFTTAWGVSTLGTASLSGVTSTTIFGGGKDGTIVNHTHEDGPDTFTLVPDGCPDGGTRVSKIVKNGVAMPTVVVPTVLLPAETLMTPFTKNVIDLTTFSFRSEVFGGTIYETQWQSLCSDIWDIFAADVYGAGSPFPGSGYSGYRVYAPTLGESATGGTFAAGTTYKH